MKLPPISLLILAGLPLVVVAKRRRVPFMNCLSTKSNSGLATIKPARSRIECSVICLNDPACLSASYCKSGDEYSCQLSEVYLDGGCSGLQADGDCTQTAVVYPCENGGTFFSENRTCHCIEGFLGDYCQRRYRDCTETPLAKINYFIQPIGSNYVFEWKCGFSNRTDMATFVFLYNHDYALTFQQAKDGIPIAGEYFFLGLETLHQLTTQGKYDLYVQAASSGKDMGRVIYTNVRVNSAAEGYALHWDFFERSTSAPGSDQILDGFGGNGDVTKNLNGARFGTHDNDISGCARANNASWWYNPLGCTTLEFDLNGLVWPTNRTGTVEMELLQITVMYLVPVYWYVEDDLVL